MCAPCITPTNSRIRVFIIDHNALHNISVHFIKNIFFNIMFPVYLLVYTCFFSISPLPSSAGSILDWACLQSLSSAGYCIIIWLGLSSHSFSPHHTSLHFAKQHPWYKTLPRSSWLDGLRLSTWLWAHLMWSSPSTLTKPAHWSALSLLHTPA